MRTVRVRHRRVGRVVVVVPSIFTLANLFFGMWAIVLAAQGEFYRSSWWIVIAGVADILDGLSARMSKTGSRFGAELDSLADLVSFGLAPAFLLYFLHFARQGQFAWLFLYAFVVCVALRLARFNLQLGDAPKRWFTGLPSPAAGMTLATYYPFTRTPLYEVQLAAFPWNLILIFLVITLSVAMVSNIRYARLPRIGFRTTRGLLSFAVLATIVAFAIWERDVFFFPLGLAYMTYGMVRAAVGGIMERSEDSVEEGRPGRRLPRLLKAEQAGRWRSRGGPPPPPQS